MRAKIPIKIPQPSLAVASPAREGQDRWRAVWYENGSRRQCEAVSGERLAARLEKLTGRLAADAPNVERAGADLIAHDLDADRLPADQRWSRKHAYTQRRLCERFAAPVIGRTWPSSLHRPRRPRRKPHPAGPRS
ncbi:MAG TPA: hypothetical protein VKV80_21360 [Streptosporangiaceae bacterium]|nr:hypothetical protein [Streptosporangiaceae bacterium]